MDIEVDWNTNIWFSHSTFTGISAVTKSESHDRFFVNQIRNVDADMLIIIVGAN
jgi:hypothetical protein